jgi:ADP-heptose:LPS heptosyltransferase
LKPKLLILELWGIGDLALALPFVTAASLKYEVTLLAKPAALEFPIRVLGGVEVLSLKVPWTRFKGKYRLHRWPWHRLTSTLSTLRARNFDIAVSARPDPRDHVLMWLTGARARIGFPRAGTSCLLNRRLLADRPHMHRFGAWRRIAAATGVLLPLLSSCPRSGKPGAIVVHSGAARPVRVWPLDQLALIVDQLRRLGHEVQVACNPDQMEWWLRHGEAGVISPGNLEELCALMEAGRAFIGNDSGPGHVAALLGLPTFTVFGPQLPELFAPIHPMAEWSAGKECRFKPCRDACRFATPHCLDISAESLWPEIRDFADKHSVIRKSELEQIGGAPE